MLKFASVLFVVCSGASLVAGPIELLVDQTQSSADIELCLSVVGTSCDSDMSPIAGTVNLSLDCPPAPGEVTLRDFVLDLVDNVEFLLDYGALGQFGGTGQDLNLSYADPASPMPPAPLSADRFTLANVPVVAEGLLNYEATGGVCISLTLAGYNCIDTIDLSTIALDPLTVDGTLVVAGSEVNMVLGMNISGPVVPDNPDLGTMAIAVSIVAVGEIPPPCCPGDMTGDDRVEMDDLGKLVGCTTGPNGGAEGACQCGDLNNDNDVDLDDFAAFQVLFDGSPV